MMETRCHVTCRTCQFTVNTTLHRSPIGLSIYHKVSATMFNLSTIRSVQRTQRVLLVLSRTLQNHRENSGSL